MSLGERGHGLYPSPFSYQPSFFFFVAEDTGPPGKSLKGERGQEILGPRPIKYFTQEDFLICDKIA